MTEHETPSTGQAMSVVEVTSFETEAGYVGSDDGHEAGDAEMEELLIDDGCYFILKSFAKNANCPIELRLPTFSRTPRESYHQIFSLRIC
jgi:hypothetical protein